MSYSFPRIPSIVNCPRFESVDEALAWAEQNSDVLRQAVWGNRVITLCEMPEGEITRRNREKGLSRYTITDSGKIVQVPSETPTRY